MALWLRRLLLSAAVGALVCAPVRAEHGKTRFATDDQIRNHRSRAYCAGAPLLFDSPRLPDYESPPDYVEKIVSAMAGRSTELAETLDTETKFDGLPLGDLLDRSLFLHQMLRIERTNDAQLKLPKNERLRNALTAIDAKIKKQIEKEVPKGFFVALGPDFTATGKTRDLVNWDFVRKDPSLLKKLLDLERKNRVPEKTGVLPALPQKLESSAWKAYNRGRKLAYVEASLLGEHVLQLYESAHRPGLSGDRLNRELEGLDSSLDRERELICKYPEAEREKIVSELQSFSRATLEETIHHGKVLSVDLRIELLKLAAIDRSRLAWLVEHGSKGVVETVAGLIADGESRSADELRRDLASLEDKTFIELTRADGTKWEKLDPILQQNLRRMFDKSPLLERPLADFFKPEHEAGLKAGRQWVEEQLASPEFSKLPIMGRKTLIHLAGRLNKWQATPKQVTTDLELFADAAAKAQAPDFDPIAELAALDKRISALREKRNDKTPSKLLALAGANHTPADVAVNRPPRPPRPAPAPPPKEKIETLEDWIAFADKNKRFPPLQKWDDLAQLIEHYLKKFYPNSKYAEAELNDLASPRKRDFFLPWVLAELSSLHAEEMDPLKKDTLIHLFAALKNYKSPPPAVITNDLLSIQEALATGSPYVSVSREFQALSEEIAAHRLRTEPRWDGISTLLKLNKQKLGPAVDIDGLRKMPDTEYKRLIDMMGTLSMLEKDRLLHGFKFDQKGFRFEPNKDSGFNVLPMPLRAAAPGDELAFKQFIREQNWRAIQAERKNPILDPGHKVSRRELFDRYDAYYRGSNLKSLTESFCCLPGVDREKFLDSPATAEEKVAVRTLLERHEAIVRESLIFKGPDLPQLGLLELVNTDPKNRRASHTRNALGELEVWRDLLMKRSAEPKLDLKRVNETIAQESNKKGKSLAHLALLEEAKADIEKEKPPESLADKKAAFDHLISDTRRLARDLARDSIQALSGLPGPQDRGVYEELHGLFKTHNEIKAILERSRYGYNAGLPRNNADLGNWVHLTYDLGNGKTLKLRWVHRSILNSPYCSDPLRVQLALASRGIVPDPFDENAEPAKKDIGDYEMLRILDDIYPLYNGLLYQENYWWKVKFGETVILDAAVKEKGEDFKKELLKQAFEDPKAFAEKLKASETLDGAIPEPGRERLLTDPRTRDPSIPANRLASTTAFSACNGNVRVDFPQAPQKLRDKANEIQDKALAEFGRAWDNPQSEPYDKKAADVGAALDALKAADPTLYSDIRNYFRFFNNKGVVKSAFQSDAPPQLSREHFLKDIPEKVDGKSNPDYLKFSTMLRGLPPEILVAEWARHEQDEKTRGEAPLVTRQRVETAVHDWEKSHNVYITGDPRHSIDVTATFKPEAPGGKAAESVDVLHRMVADSMLESYLKRLMEPRDQDEIAKFLEQGLDFKKVNEKIRDVLNAHYRIRQRSDVPDPFVTADAYQNAKSYFILQLYEIYQLMKPLADRDKRPNGHAGSYLDPRLKKLIDEGDPALTERQRLERMAFGIKKIIGHLDADLTRRNPDATPQDLEQRNADAIDRLVERFPTAIAHWYNTVSQYRFDGQDKVYHQKTPLLLLPKREMEAVLALNTAARNSGHRDDSFYADYPWGGNTALLLAPRPYDRQSPAYKWFRLDRIDRGIRRFHTNNHLVDKHMNFTNLNPEDYIPIPETDDKNKKLAVFGLHPDKYSGFSTSAQAALAELEPFAFDALEWMVMRKEFVPTDKAGGGYWRDVDFGRDEFTKISKKQMADRVRIAHNPNASAIMRYVLKDGVLSMYYGDYLNQLIALRTEALKGKKNPAQVAEAKFFSADQGERNRSRIVSLIQQAPEMKYDEREKTRLWALEELKKLLPECASGCSSERLMELAKKNPRKNQQLGMSLNPDDGYQGNLAEQLLKMLLLAIDERDETTTAEALALEARKGGGERFNPYLIAARMQKEVEKRNKLTTPAPGESPELKLDREARLAKVDKILRLLDEHKLSAGTVARNNYYQMRSDQLDTVLNLHEWMTNTLPVRGVSGTKDVFLKALQAGDPTFFDEIALQMTPDYRALAFNPAAHRRQIIDDLKRTGRLSDDGKAGLELLASQESMGRLQELVEEIKQFQATGNSGPLPSAASEFGKKKEEVKARILDQLRHDAGQELLREHLDKISADEKDPKRVAFVDKLLSVGGQWSLNPGTDKFADESHKKFVADNAEILGRLQSALGVASLEDVKKAHQADPLRNPSETGHLLKNRESMGIIIARVQLERALGDQKIEEDLAAVWEKWGEKRAELKKDAAKQLDKTDDKTLEEWETFLADFQSKLEDDQNLERKLENLLKDLRFEEAALTAKLESLLKAQKSYDDNPSQKYKVEHKEEKAQLDQYVTTLQTDLDKKIAERVAIETQLFDLLDSSQQRALKKATESGPLTEKVREVVTKRAAIKAAYDPAQHFDRFLEDLLSPEEVEEPKEGKDKKPPPRPLLSTPAVDGRIPVRGAQIERARKYVEFRERAIKLAKVLVAHDDWKSRPEYKELVTQAKQGWYGGVLSEKHVESIVEKARAEGRPHWDKTKDACNQLLKKWKIGCSTKGLSFGAAEILDGNEKLTTPAYLSEKLSEKDREAKEKAIEEEQAEIRKNLIADLDNTHGLFDDPEGEPDWLRLGVRSKKKPSERFFEMVKKVWNDQGQPEMFLYPNGKKNVAVRYNSRTKLFEFFPAEPVLAALQKKEQEVQNGFDRDPKLSLAWRQAGNDFFGNWTKHEKEKAGGVEGNSKDVLAAIKDVRRFGNLEIPTRARPVPAPAWAVASSLDMQYRHGILLNARDTLDKIEKDHQAFNRALTFHAAVITAWLVSVPFGGGWIFAPAIQGLVVADLGIVGSKVMADNWSGPVDPKDPNSKNKNYFFFSDHENSVYEMPAMFMLARAGTKPLQGLTGMAEGAAHRWSFALIAAGAHKTKSLLSWGPEAWTDNMDWLETGLHFLTGQIWGAGFDQKIAAFAPGMIQRFLLASSANTVLHFGMGYVESFKAQIKIDEMIAEAEKLGETDKVAKLKKIKDEWDHTSKATEFVLSSIPTILYFAAGAAKHSPEVGRIQRDISRMVKDGSGVKYSELKKAQETREAEDRAKDVEELAKHGPKKPLWRRFVDKLPFIGRKRHGNPLDEALLQTPVHELQKLRERAERPKDETNPKDNERLEAEALLEHVAKLLGIKPARFMELLKDLQADPGWGLIPGRLMTRENGGWGKLGIREMQAYLSRGAYEKMNGELRAKPELRNDPKFQEELLSLDPDLLSRSQRRDAKDLYKTLPLDWSKHPSDPILQLATIWAAKDSGNRYLQGKGSLQRFQEFLGFVNRSPHDNFESLYADFVKFASATPKQLLQLAKGGRLVNNADRAYAEGTMNENDAAALTFPHLEHPDLRTIRFVWGEKVYQKVLLEQVKELKDKAGPNDRFREIDPEGFVHFSQYADAGRKAVGTASKVGTKLNDLVDDYVDPKTVQIMFASEPMLVGRVYGPKSKLVTDALKADPALKQKLINDKNVPMAAIENYLTPQEYAAAAKLRDPVGPMIPFRP